ncbi:MAG: DUF4232 domain-containing protein [Candidatus Dormibacteria bacterium]
MATSDRGALSFVVLAAVLTAALAACAGAAPARPTSSPLPSTPSPATPSPEPSALPSVAPTAAPTVAPTPSPTPPIVTAGEPTCASSQLQIAYSQALGGGAAGSFVVALGIWNRGSRPCKLRGWATVQFLNPTGGLVPTHWVETTSDFSGSAESRVVSLLPCAGADGCAPDSTPAAYISVAGDDVIEPCVTAAGVRVVVPGSSTPVVVNLRASGFEDGQIFCSDGEAWLLPILSPFSVL